MSSWLTAITTSIYHEYDRRIRRASLITEYGAAHHDHHEHADAHGHAEDEGDVVIANVPLGATVSVAPEAHAAPTHADTLGTPALEPPPAEDVPAAPAPAEPSAEEAGEAEIVNTPPGTAVKQS